jgi:hypothetical protein
METQQIFAALKSEPSTTNNFSGVYPIDKIPLKQHLDLNENGETFIVVNLDPAHKKGSHWVAIYVNVSRRVNEYFDSYGREPPVLLHKFLGSYLQSSIQVQSALSTTCGQWCMIYIWHRCNGFTLGGFIKSFSKTSLEANDEKINSLVNANFSGKKQQVCSVRFLSRQIARALEEGGSFAPIRI